MKSWRDAAFTMGAGRLRTALTAALLALTACGHPSPAPAPAHSVFRAIDISPYGSITLGAPFSQRSLSIVIPAGSDRFAVISRFGFAGSTDSIVVRVDSGNRVTEIHFVYRAGMNFAAAVADYDTSLGRPVHRIARNSTGGRLERLTWQDAHTRFDLTRFTPRSGVPRIMSTMLDRTLHR